MLMLTDVGILQVRHGCQLLVIYLSSLRTWMCLLLP